MGFYPDTVRYNDSTEVAEQITDVAWWFMAATAALSGVIIIIMTVYMLRERSRETGILYALGASGGSIVFGHLLETMFLLCVAACISLGTGLILTKLSETSAEYIQNMVLQYQITPAIILSLAIFVLSEDLLSTGILSVSILKHPPSVLISAK
jgi:ABC-type antimicrobial peptide transport system permease subunit